MHKWDVVDLNDKARAWSARSSAKTDERDRDPGRETRKQREQIPRDKIKQIAAARAGRSWWAPCRSRRASGSRRCSTSRGIKHQVLNAKHHQREAEIVAQAGRKERRDHRHQHGRPRHRHHPRRQSRDHGLGPAAGQIRHAARRAASEEWDALVREIEAARADEGRRARRSAAWAACTSSAPSGTRPAASTCSFAAAAAGRAIPAAAASISRWKTT